MVIAFSCVYQAFMMYWFAYGYGRYASFLESAWIKAVTLLGAAVRVPAMVSILPVRVVRRHCSWARVG
jgi:hypothetical protein